MAPYVASYVEKRVVGLKVHEIQSSSISHLAQVCGNQWKNKITIVFPYYSLKSLLIPPPLPQPDSAAAAQLSLPMAAKHQQNHYLMSNREPFQPKLVLPFDLLAPGTHPNPATNIIKQPNKGWPIQTQEIELGLQDQEPQSNLSLLGDVPNQYWEGGVRTPES